MTTYHCEHISKIFMVSDLPSHEKVFSRIALENEFSNIIVKTEADEILIELRKVPIRALIIDLKSILSCEYDLIQTCRNDASLKNTFICIISERNRDEDILEFLDYGADDFIYTDCNIFEWKSKLQLILHNIQHSSEQSISDSVLVKSSEYFNTRTLLINFLHKVFPDSENSGKRCAEIVLKLCKLYYKFSNDELIDIETACLLIHCGRLTHIDAGEVNLAEYGITAYELLGKDIQFNSVAKILKHLYEHYDGCGVPDRLHSTQIPLASRIISPVICMLERSEKQNKDYRAVIQDMQRDSNSLFSPKVLIFLTEIIQSSAYSENSTLFELRLSEIEPGQKIVKDIYNYSGKKVLAAGTVLSENMLQRIREVHTNDPICGNIFIEK